MTYRCSDFCQRPPEASGRWECPDILGIVHMNCFVNNGQLILATFYLSGKSTQTLQFCYGSYSSQDCGCGCSKSPNLSIKTRMNPRRRIEGYCDINYYYFKYLLFVQFQPFPLKCQLLDDVFFFLVLVCLYPPYQDTETSWSFRR